MLYANRDEATAVRVAAIEYVVIKRLRGGPRIRWFDGVSQNT